MVTEQPNGHEQIAVNAGLFRRDWRWVFGTPLSAVEEWRSEERKIARAAELLRWGHGGKSGAATTRSRLAFLTRAEISDQNLRC